LSAHCLERRLKAQFSQIPTPIISVAMCIALHQFEEQFDLPAVFVKCCNCQRWQDKVVAQKDQGLACFWVLESNPSQVLLVLLRGIEAFEQQRLVANDAGFSVCRCAVNAPHVHVDFGLRDKKSARSMHGIEPSKVQVTAVHHLEGASLDRHEVEHVDLLHLYVANEDKHWDCTSQIQQRVQFDCALGAAKWRPIEQAQEKIDCGGIERVSCVLQIESDQSRVGKELACSTNQHLHHVRPNMSITRFVRIGQRRAMNAVTQSHRVKLGRIRTERYFDLAKTFAPGQLREDHHSKLLRASHASNAGVATITIDDKNKAGKRYKCHELCKQCLEGVHEISPRG
jgi:hypothetical protein